jgi:UDP-N-acetylmuramoyl-L-alanyl-D-glutamate--2,6-diaminopimelate ligase
VVSDSTPPAELKPYVGWAQVAAGAGRRALGQISANFFGHPAKQLKLTGVTGTNGKTTTTYLLESILTTATRKAALLGTIEFRVNGQVFPAPHTTPEALELNQFFREAVNQGATEGVMEVSSHALAQERVFGIPYDVAVFTNLTRDHLDYHRDMDDYFSAKQRLFTGCGTEPPRVAVINSDDPYGQRMIDVALAHRLEVVSYGINAGDFQARDINFTPKGTQFDMVSRSGRASISTALVGRVNVYNILAAAAAAQARGCSLPQIAQAILSVKNVPGRFQRVDNGQPFTVVVDYAHTDDALRNLTKLAREFVADSKGRVITIFGCGGDRDRAKRPMMGRAAAENSDFVLLTSDNPRSEDPLRIIHEVLPGLNNASVDFSIEPDRERAIRLGIRLAQPGDIVLVAGKGHEKVQITRSGSHPFDDVAVAHRALYAAGYTEDFSRAISSGTARSAT